jgi:hypothetical protein
MKKKGLTYEQLDELRRRTEDGETASDIIASWGMKIDRYYDRLVKI